MTREEALPYVGARRLAVRFRAALRRCDQRDDGHRRPEG